MVTKQPRGRPTKLTPELQEKIVSCIRVGNYIETAAAYAGISKDTLYKWLRRGARAKTGMHRDFADAIKRALAVAEMDAVATITAASQKNWTAAAWRLERSHPDRWGRKSRIIADVSTEADESAESSCKGILASPCWKEIEVTVKGVLEHYPGAQEELFEEFQRLIEQDEQKG